MSCNCEIDITKLYGTLNNPNAQDDFLNPNAEENEHSIPAFSIKIEFNGTQYEFGSYYVSKSMSITSTFGQRGQARFVVADDDYDGSILHFIPAEEMYVEIRNWNPYTNSAGSTIYFAGYTREIIQKMLGVRDDLSEVANYTIVCTDLYHQLERRPVNTVYENKTLGFILRDVITRYTNLDASEIDSSLGFTVDQYPIDEKFPSQVLQHIISLTDATYYIDPDTRKIYVTTKGSGDVRFPIVINDDNLYDYFDRDFELRRQNDQIRNAIKLWFNERYDAGTVNVSNGSNIVAGFGAPPETEWEDLNLEGLQFKLQNDDATYTIERNNSVGATQELRLSSDFAETTQSDQAYEIRGRRRSVNVFDEESIGLMKTIRGDDGLFWHVVSEDSNAYTFTEARRFAAALLSLSRPLPKGTGKSTNMTWQFKPLQAGIVVPFDLPNSKRFVGDVVVQQIEINHIGGEVNALQASDGEVQPYCSLRFTFTATLTSMQAQMRKMMQDLRKVKVDIKDPGDITDYRRLTETFVLKDCICPSIPESVSELLQFGDDVEVQQEVAGPLFYSELHYTRSNTVDYSFTSD